MNPTNDNFSTPKQTKRLGLRRSSSILKDSSAKKALGSVAKNKFIEITTPASTPRRRLPQSDVKINYKNLEQNEGATTHAVNTPGTPKSTNTSDLQRLAVSTNCRPYRLALSKKVREKMTKKRLEFYLANELDKEDAEEKETHEKQENAKTELKPTNKEDILKQIEIARKELKSRQEHVKKVQDLQEAVNVWKTGFSSALLDLQEHIEPRLETATLLERLHIPQEMIKYIDE
ncbi:uncharacterized protein LOC135954703 [Calliphora vicina]|uniref:uncharacterized protein LOC135954703 n=1 Tax=Calliphora vicina TaxID=7373 RepID=UPI00325A606B